MVQPLPPRLPWKKALDIPPAWLVLFIALAWLQADRFPLGQVALPLVDLAAGVLFGSGLLLIVLAIVELRRAGTTVIPHLEPEALVITGVFARSRNPIYLGDTCILTGLILFWKAWPSLLLVPLFVWVITDRFICTEEARLEDQFGERYASWARRVRRWL